MTGVLGKIVSELEAVCPVGEGWVSSETQYPYTTYSYNAETTEQRGDTTLTLDVWDRNTIATTVESISAQIRQKLDRQIFKDNDKFVWCYLDTQSSIRDEDPQIKRRRLIFIIHDYAIGGN